VLISYWATLFCKYCSGLGGRADAEKLVECEEVYWKRIDAVAISYPGPIHEIIEFHKFGQVIHNRLRVGMENVRTVDMLVAPNIGVASSKTVSADVIAPFQHEALDTSCI
jgi:hypothetical protein